MKQRIFYLLSSLVVVLFCSQLAVAKGPFLDEYDHDLDIKDPDAWKEKAVELPPFPEDENLLEFPVEEDTGASLRYYVDSKSLSVGDDGVVHYVLVIIAAQGAKNVMFEGARCDAREYKTYAFGDGKGGFRRLRKPAWRDIRKNNRTAYRQRLMDHYLCHPEYPTARDPQSIAEAIKYRSEDRDCTLCD